MLYLESTIIPLLLSETLRVVLPLSLDVMLVAVLDCKSVGESTLSLLLQIASLLLDVLRPLISFSSNGEHIS